jgi:hypothetical protein
MEQGKDITDTSVCARMTGQSRIRVLIWTYRHEETVGLETLVDVSHWNYLSWIVQIQESTRDQIVP